MITASNLGANTIQLKKSVLLMDTNPDRRALRKKIMALKGVEMIGAGNLAEAASIWHRDRYDMVLIDLRLDYRGALAFRDEIKKDSPTKWSPSWWASQTMFLSTPLPVLMFQNSTEWNGANRCEKQ